jgi:hypothetical protein
MPAPSPDPNPSDVIELPFPTLPERRGGSAGAGRDGPAGNTSADALDASPAPGASTEVADEDGLNWYDAPEETTLADKSSPESSKGAGSADTAADSVSALDTVVVAEAGAATDGGGGRLAGR